MKKRKASLHVSIDEKLKQRLQQIAEHLSVPLSHLVSMSLGKFAVQYERKFIENDENEEPEVRKKSPRDHHSEASLDAG